MYDPLHLDIFPPTVEASPAGHIARRQPLRPVAYDGDIEGEVPLPGVRPEWPLPDALWATRRYVSTVSTWSAPRWSGTDRVADRVTAYAGSLPFVYIHTVWFGIWIALNVGIVGVDSKFDPIPLRVADHDRQPRGDLPGNVRVSQNHRAARADLRAEIDSAYPRSNARRQ